VRIATYNVNGINARLSVLLDWFRETAPDIVCLQELKAPEERFPIDAIRGAGCGAIWHGQKSWNGVAILARGTEPIEVRRALPQDPEDTHSRYIEALVDNTVVGCLYLPNGNPAPGPKFDYKLRWFERLSAHATELLARNGPVVLAGDFNVIPTDLDVYAPERWFDDALPTGGTRGIPEPHGAGADRRPAGLASRRTDIHVLEILPERGGARCRYPHRSSPRKPGGGRAARRRWGGPARAALGKDERSCARMD